MKKIKCKCGREIEPQQARAAKVRWAKLTDAERAEQMRRVRAKGRKERV